MESIVPPANVAGPSRRVEALAARIGPQFTRYAIVALLLLFGAMKWTGAEARGIEPFVAHSPFWSWLYPLLGVQGVSIFFGVLEIAAAAAIALRPWSPRVSALGSAFTILMFLNTISFLFTTPGLLASPESGFVLKDLVLLGGSIWCLAEALTAERARAQADRNG